MWQHVRQVGLTLPGLPLPPVMQPNNSLTMLFQDAVLVSPSGKGLKMKGRGLRQTESQTQLKKRQSSEEAVGKIH